MPEKKKIILTRIIFAAALLGITPMFGGIGTALGLWEPMTGFRMTMNYYNISIISSLIVLYLVIKHFITDVTQSICTFLVLIIFLGAGYLLGINKEAPDITGLRGIHDVTTDMENPPEFIALLDAPGRRNSFDYPAETADRQKAKFPWVKPLMTMLPVNEAYERALIIAREMNWDIVGEDPQVGRFEATDYTKWFNFHDDLVVKVSPTIEGSRIDLRSLSRVGGSDHGLGATRIMDFQRKFKAK
ncbi:MAG: DUF1499 domain-containing protein [Kordiimonadaceae bacterium]|nr:DUF1499 domain-containing protein [Kordiimonadaceae bacterium]MBT6033806.1 DUF1499 domain-containing protein [Kordiimonadaceae bacterium]